MFPKFYLGQVYLLCTGDQLIPWMNTITQQGIQLEKVQWIDHNRIRLQVGVPDFFRMATYCRQYGVKIRIQKKKGLVFLLQRGKKRKFFVFGSILFVALLIFFSSFVWQIQIEGGREIPKEQVQSLLKEVGVYKGQLIVQLPEAEKVQRSLLAKLPQASWIGYRLKGTQIIVTVVEKKKVDKKKSNQPGPVHLVAKKGAMIHDIQVVKGNPIVDVNDVVEKGQLLVSGQYGDTEDEEKKGSTVGAEGVVLGEVWYESEVTVPLVHQRKEYTGERTLATYPFLSSLVLRNPFSKEQSFSAYETRKHVSTLQIGDWKIPAGLLREEHLQIRQVEQKLTIPEAVTIGKKRAVLEMKQTLGKEGKINKENILHQRVENGKVYLKLYFNVLENIAVKQPFSQGE